MVGAYALGWSGALLSAAGGVFLLALLRRRRKPQTLDISPVGQLRLAVYLEHGAARCAVTGAVAALSGPLPGILPPVPPVPTLQPVAGLQRLMPGSTLWPALLVLCLADGAGRRSSVLVQRGRGCAMFRPLAVACRAIAARGGEE